MSEFVSFDPAELDRRGLAGLINGLVAPRPIAWASTVAVDGTRNLAPFSYFNAFSTQPPTVALGPGSRGGVHKDTLANVKATGELVVNMVSFELAQIANRTSAEFDGQVDEWELDGLDLLPSETVRPPRVAAAPASFECRVHTIVDVGSEDVPTNSVVIATITRIHVQADALDGTGVLPQIVDLVGRMGGDLWCTTRDRFTLRRPASADPAEVVTEDLRPVLD